MPSGTYGRGGGNFAKKPKSPALSSDTSTKSSSLKSNEKVSLLKKIMHAMPGSGSQSNKSRMSAGSQPRRDRDIPTRHTNTNPRQRQTRGSTLPARPKTSSSHPSAPLRISFANDVSHPTTGMDTTHRNERTPAVNLHTLTPSSSEDECSDSEHSRSVRPLSPKDILPFPSRQMIADNGGTAVNEGPFSSSPEVPRTVKTPALTATGNRRRVQVRSSSLNDSFLRRPAPSQPQSRPEREVGDLNRIGDQKKALAALEGTLDSSTRQEGRGNPNHRPVTNDNNYKRECRVTLATPATTIPRIPPAPTRRPISELGSFADLLPSNMSEHTRRWSENLNIISGSGSGFRPGAAPSSDPFNHLFTSCVISLILLIILAAGKDILYVVALLPVLMTLAKHFLDLNQLQLGLYTPLMRKNLESLLSI